jgi:CheY-like chemotaxis protein
MLAGYREPNHARSIVKIAITAVPLAMHLDVGLGSDPNAEEAIEILESRDDIRLIITDINMPGSMDGLRLAAAVRDRWAPIKIIYCHRNGSASKRREEMAMGSQFLPKPYAPDRVLAAVRMVH